MILTDTHTHLYLENFNEDRKEAIDRAFDKGVKYLFLPNIDSTSIEDMLKLASEYPDYCFPMMGLHPGSVDKDYPKELKTIEKWLHKEKFCAIGEVGIDLYWDKTYYKEQEEAFLQQMHWASEMDLPLVIHSRKSLNEIISIIKKYPNLDLTGVFHCFPGSPEDAEKIVDMGFKIGIGGVVTFKNAKMAKVVEKIPLETILLETDAPFLTPHPYRGKRNESAYIYFIAEKIAEIKQVDIEKVAEVTTKSALEMFKLEKNE